MSNKYKIVETQIYNKKLFSIEKQFLLFFWKPVKFYWGKNGEFSAQFCCETEQQAKEAATVLASSTIT